MTNVVGLTVEEIAPTYMADSRTTPDGRPWLLMGMISSLDGSAVVAGGSTALGGPPDRQVFRALRAVSDVVVVGAGTVRAEGYRAPELAGWMQEWRKARGMTEAPRIAIVTESMRIEPTDSLAASRPLVFTSERSAEQASDVVDWAEVVPVGSAAVDPATMLASFQARKMNVVLTEGGPRLNGALARYVHEVCMTVSPLLAGGDGPRIVDGPAVGRPATLDRIVHSEGFVMLRYLFT